MKINKILIILGLFIILISTFSQVADAGDKTLDYKSKEKIANIKESGDDIVDVQLIYNTDFCYKKCEYVLKVTPYETFKTPTLKSSLDKEYKTDYYKFNSYGGMNKDDSLFSFNGMYLFNENTERWDSFDMKGFTFRAGETYYIKNMVIKEDVAVNIEWIPTFYGVEISQWATWNFTNGLLGYYSLDTGNSTETPDDYSGNNATVSGSTFNVSGGKINGGYYNWGNNQYLDLPILADGLSDFSLSLWFYANDLSANDAIFDINTTGGLNQMYGRLQTDGTINIQWKTSGGVSEYTTSETYGAGTWHLYTMTYNGSNFILYINGTETTINESKTGTIDTAGATIEIGQITQYSNYLIGRVDEIGVWNRTLNSSEVLQLYNSGTGYNPIGFSVDLDTPTDSYTLGGNRTDFSCSGSISDPDKQFVNVTLYIWNSTGSIFSQNTTTISGSTFDESWEIGAFNVDTYEWNCLAYDNSSSSTFSDANFTINSTNSAINSVSYTTTVTELSTNVFTLNLSSKNTPSAIVTYNGTNDTSSCTATGNDFICTNSIIAPILSNPPSENVSFFYNINDTITSYTSDIYNQTITQLVFGLCNDTLNQTALNFTLKDEINKSQINGTIDATFIYWPNGSDPTDGYNNISLQSSDLSLHQFCISPAGASLELNSSVQFTAGGYVKRTYYTDSLIVSNVSQNIDLYLANDTALEHQISLLDTDDEPIKDALIQVQRYYRDTGIASTVEILKTDSSGRDIAHFLMTGEEYQLIVIKDSVIIHTGTPFKPYCPQSAVGEPCEREIRIGIGTSPLVINQYPDFSDSLTFNNETNIFTYTWTDTSGASHTGRLYVVQKGLTDTTICDINTTAASGTLLCNVTAYATSGEILAYAYNTHSLERLEQFISVIFNDNYLIFGDDGIFWGFLLLFTCVCLGLATRSITNVGIFTIVGLILVRTIGLVYIPYHALIGLVVVIGVLLYKMKGD